MSTASARTNVLLEGRAIAAAPAELVVKTFGRTDQGPVTSGAVSNVSTPLENAFSQAIDPLRSRGRICNSAANVEPAKKARKRKSAKHFIINYCITLCSRRGELRESHLLRRD